MTSTKSLDEPSLICSPVNRSPVTCSPAYLCTPGMPFSEEAAGQPSRMPMRGAEGSASCLPSLSSADLDRVSGVGQEMLSAAGSGEEMTAGADEVDGLVTGTTRGYTGGRVEQGMDVGTCGGAGAEARALSRSSIKSARRPGEGAETAEVNTLCTLAGAHSAFQSSNIAWRAKFGDEAERPRWAELLRSGVAIFDLDYDAILAAMYALSVSAEGDCYLCVPPDPGIEAAALGASESALPGTAPAEALHTFTLDSEGVAAHDDACQHLPCQAMGESRAHATCPPSYPPFCNVCRGEDGHIMKFHARRIPDVVPVDDPAGRDTAMWQTDTRTHIKESYFLPVELLEEPTSTNWFARKWAKQHPGAQAALKDVLIRYAGCVTKIRAHASLAIPAADDASFSRVSHFVRATPYHFERPWYTLPEVLDPESDRARAASPTVSRLLATAVIDLSFESAAASALVAELLDFAAACRLDYATALVAESASASPPSVGDECALGTDVLEDRQEEFECLAPAVPRFSSMLLAPEGDPDAPDIPTPRSYAEAITGPYSSQWQAAMDAEMASWKSTGTYVKRPPGSPPAFKARYVARGFSQRQGVDYFQTFSPSPKMTTLWVLLHVAAQRDYELHSLDFSTAFLQGSLHEEIWLRRPPGFTKSFPVGTQWSLRRLVYGLRQVPREWHDTLRTTLAALGFAPATADPLLFLRTDTSLPPYYVLVNVDDLVFATTDTEALTLVKSELQKRHTCTDLEPSGPYQELVVCIMYLMTCTRPDLAYPLSLLDRYVAPGRHRKVHWDAAKRVLHYLCSTSGMGLLLGGRGPVVLTGHADAFWVDDSATQRSSQGYTFSLGSDSISRRSTCSVLSSGCEAEIYAGAMAAQELRWLTYLLSDLGEQPRSPPVKYVDNKAMIALCQEHRLEHRTKHIALRYFLARELHQRGQLRLAYVATRANTADIFTKALPTGDHQRFSTVLGLVPTLPHLLTA
ncbi:unnamed protein product [Closterium sp. NIES-53]